MSKSKELQLGLQTAYIDETISSNLAFQPQFISNNPKEGKKVLASIEDELLACEHFQISVAFITLGGIAPLLQTLKELEKRAIRGEILTTNYLNFSEPKALKKLNEFNNITLKMYDAESAPGGFHTKGYIFKKGEIYRIIIGSSNMTGTALAKNREWNTKIISTNQGLVAKEIADEFYELWNSPYALNFEDFYQQYEQKYSIIQKQRQIAKQDPILSIEKYRLKPNKMQTQFISNLRKIINAGEEKALLISATGTGKTYASAFAMRELGFKRVLFLVHRQQLARQTKRSYQKVFSNQVSMGIVGGGYSEYDKDYVFAMIQTLNKDDYLKKYKPNAFDCIILDEAHHSSANTYQKVMSYFKPKLWLGMTATPDKKETNQQEKSIYEIFHYQIAHEIRLQQAMEEDFLCPFHYFGISDLSIIDDEINKKSKKLNDESFRKLTSDERVRHIIEQAHYFGYSGERVKGLIFCTRVEEAEELSIKFNHTINPETGKYFRTTALSGKTSDEERQDAFEKLAMDERDADKNNLPLDYIFSVEILNEGVDIVEVNQVIMLRPTQSPIVFIQQLGRGLRKAEGKEFVVVLDFIGNYKNNFMIPVALSGDCTYNSDTIRKYVISGNNTIPGVSTVHFDEIAKNKIFLSIDKLKGMKAIIKESYLSLKGRLGRIPSLLDFYEAKEIDPLVIIKEYKSYPNFLSQMEKNTLNMQFSQNEISTLEYLSKTILKGIRPHELEVLQYLLKHKIANFEEFNKYFYQKYAYKLDTDTFDQAINVLQGKFVSTDKEYQKYKDIQIVLKDESYKAERLQFYMKKIQNLYFDEQIRDIVKIGLKRYEENYATGVKIDDPFVLYQKYSRRDVCFLMNCERDLSSTMYGMKKFQDHIFIFITYHKVKASDEQSYVNGKPDYADSFEDNMIFNWDSQIGRGVDSSYVKEVIQTKNKHLFVKKSDAETNFYYMGKFDILNIKADKKMDNKGKERDITKFQMKMHHAVRDDLLRYFESSILAMEEK